MSEDEEKHENSHRGVQLGSRYVGAASAPPERAREHRVSGRVQSLRGRRRWGKYDVKDPELEAGPGSTLVFLFLAVPTGLWGSESTCDGGGV